MTYQILHQFITYHKFGEWEVAQLQRTEPSAFNGIVCVRKYRVTVQEIVESEDTIRQRIQELCWNCDNSDEHAALQREARVCGMDVSSTALEFGKHHKSKPKARKAKKKS